MNDTQKTKAELLAENVQLRQRVAELGEADAALRESEECYRKVFESSPVPTVIHAENRVLFINPAGVNLLGGTSPDDFMGKPIRDFIHPDSYDPQRYETIYSLRKQSSYTEVHLVRLDGTILAVMSKGLPIDYEGQAAAYHVLIDITKQRKNEAAMRALLDAQDEQVYLIDTDGIILTLNEAAAQRFGNEPDDLVGANIWDLARPIAPPELIEARKARFEAVVASGQPIYQEDQLGDLYFESRLYPVCDEYGTVTQVAVVAHDITERKQAESMLRESEERFRRVSELTSNYAYAYRVDPDRTYHLEWLTTDSFFRLTGMRRDEFDSATFDCYHSEDVERVHQDLEMVLDGQATQSEYRIFTKDEEIRWIHTSRYPVWDEDEGRVVRFYGTVQDITARKQVEQQQLELALEKERGETFRMLMGNIAHDIKTPLAIINTSLYLLEKYTDPMKQQEKMDNIKGQVRLLGSFIQDLLAISRLDSEPNLRLMPVDLNELVMDIEADHYDIIAEKYLTFTLDLEETLSPIQADQADLRRALTNLVENAVNYTPAGRTVTVRTYKQVRDVVVEVIDTGIGITTDDLPHIFDRFYRSSEARETIHTGSGLGLSIVKRVIKMHGGKVEVESVLGEGTIFRVVLPIQASL